MDEKIQTIYKVIINYEEQYSIGNMTTVLNDCFIKKKKGSVKIELD